MTCVLHSFDVTVRHMVFLFLLWAGPEVGIDLAPSAKSQ